MVFSFVGIGSSVVVTHSLGGGDKKGAAETVHTALAVSLWLGILLSFLISLNIPFLLGLMQRSRRSYSYMRSPTC